MSKEKRRRRTDQEIENAIMLATKQIIEEKGISKLSLRGVARKAGIEVSVFYNRYKDLTELLEKFTERYDYWYDDIITSFDKVDPVNYPQYSKDLFVSLVDAFKNNASMQQLILWELMEDNHITSHTNKMREQFTEHILVAFEQYFKDNGINVNLRAISGIIIAAIYFHIIHKGQVTFCGIDFSTKEGLNLLKDAIRNILDGIYNLNKPAMEAWHIAIKMKEKGIDDKVIFECTNVSLS